MKKFSFLTVDDEGLHSSTGGWRRVTAFLVDNNYLRPNSYEANSWDQQEFIESHEMRYSVYSSENGFTFSDAIECINNDFNCHDFLFMDLKFDKTGPFIEYSEEEIEGKVIGDKRIGEVKIDKGEIPAITAGMYLINLLPYNPGKPKFVFSAATETKDFIKYTELLSSRFLGNDLFFAADYSHGIEGLKKLCEPLDSYLRKRQVGVCQIQSNKLLVELQKIVKHWNNGNCVQCDEGLIPDNPADQNGDKWSLRTLFPKQVNSIEASIDVDKNTGHILEVLEADWRMLMKSYNTSNGILSHPKSLNSDDDFKKCLNTAEILDFQVEGKAKSYKPLTGMPDFDKNNKTITEGLRDNIIKNECNKDDYKISYLPAENSNSVRDYFTSLNLCDETIANNWAGKLKGFCIDYGIYPIDIAYISRIAHHNSRHANNEQPCFKFENGEGTEKISFIWDYGTNVDNQKEDEVLQKCAVVNDDIQKLKDEGLSDICKIICWRYRGEFELCLGGIGYLFVRDLRDNCYYKNEYSAELEEINVKSVIKILKLIYNGNNQTIRYKVTISKPVNI